MTKKLNTLTLCGLMIGPILGSGILFLPPLAYEYLGNGAVIAWIITMAMGVLFAYVFSRMNAAVPDNRGVSAVIGSTLGEKAGTLAANYITTAVFFGPVAVGFTAADLIDQIVPASAWMRIAIACAVIFVSALIVLLDVSFMGKVMLTLSTLAAGLLLIGAVAVLVRQPFTAYPDALPQAEPLGNTLLLLFWAIFGWEVLGNYAEDVADPKRTTMRAMKLSLFAIISVYILTTLALQQIGGGAMAALLVPVFGRYASTVFGLIAVGLCICTIVMFTGAVARQTAARLNASRPKKRFAKYKTLVVALMAVNLLVLLSYAVGWLSFENVVESTNSLFIGNAFLGLVSGFKLIRSPWMRIGIGVLLAVTVMIFLFTPLYAIVFFIAVTLVSLLPGRAARRAEERG